MSTVSSRASTERSSLKYIFEPPQIEKEVVGLDADELPALDQSSQRPEHCKSWRWLAAIVSRDTVAGVTAFVIGCVFSVSAAQTYLRPAETSFGIQQGMVGMLITGFIYHLLGTDVKHVTCVPDVFVALFFATARAKIEETSALSIASISLDSNDGMTDDDANHPQANEARVLAGTIAFVCISQVALGTALAVVGRVKLVRISDWIPFPVARGLLAGVGICVIKMGLSVSGDISGCSLALALATVLRLLDETELPRSACFLGALTSFVILFHLAVLLGIISAETFELSASAMRPNVFKAYSKIAFPAVWSALAHDKYFILDTLRVTAPNVASMVLVILLKESLSYSTIGHVLKSDDTKPSSNKAHEADLASEIEDEVTIDAERELRLLGLASIASGAVAGMYSPPSLGPMIVAQGFKPSTFRGPGLAIVACAGIACFMGLSTVAKLVPRFCCGGVLLQAGGKLIESQLVAPYSRLPTAEWLVALAICCAMPVLGLLSGVGLGLGISLALLARQYMSVGGIRYTADGAVARSVSERDDDQDDVLHDTAQHRHYVSLFGYIFFGNAAPLLSYVKFVLNHSRKAKARSLVLDLAFVTAVDASAVDVFDQVASVAKRSGCLLAICGLSPHVERALRLGAHDLLKIASVFADADRAIDASETYFLQRFYIKRAVSEEEIPSLASCLRFAAGRDPELKEIVERLAPQLSGIARVVHLKPGDRVHGETRVGDSVQPQASNAQTSLYFVAKGRVVVEHHPGHDSVATLASRTVLRRAHRVAAASRRRRGENKQPYVSESSQMYGTVDDSDSRNRRFRIAEYGAGAVAGIEAFCLGYHTMTQTVAVSPCILYAISFNDFRALRRTDPVVALDLLTLCATRLAKHNESAYEQLALLRDAFISPPHTTHPAPPSSLLSATHLPKVAQLATTKAPSPSMRMLQEDC